MLYRFYDIMVESDNGESTTLLEKEFVLDIPEHDTSNAVERAEYLGIMLDSISAASGCEVCSFSTDPS
jgi:hypothetical protein